MSDGSLIATFEGAMLKATDEKQIYFLHSQSGEAEASLISLDGQTLHQRICEGGVCCMSNILEQSNSVLVQLESGEFG